MTHLFPSPSRSFDYEALSNTGSAFLIPPNYNVINLVLPNRLLSHGTLSSGDLGFFSFDREIIYARIGDGSVFSTFGHLFRSSVSCKHTNIPSQISEPNTELSGGGGSEAVSPVSGTGSHSSSQWAPGPLLTFNIQTPPGSFAAFARGTADPTQS